MDPESIAATTQAAQFTFLLSELRTGLTFAKVASSADPDDAERRERNRKQAMTAYESFLIYQRRVNLSPEQAKLLDEKSRELEDALRGLGEQL